MKIHESEVAFLKALAASKASWEQTAADAIASNEADLVWSSHEEAWRHIARIVREAGMEGEFRAVMSEVLSGLIHSVLVALDGGSSLAEKTLLTLSDDKGHEFIRFLHEFWPEYSGEL